MVVLRMNVLQVRGIPYGKCRKNNHLTKIIDIIL